MVYRYHVNAVHARRNLLKNCSIIIAWHCMFTPDPWFSADPCWIALKWSFKDGDNILDKKARKEVFKEIVHNEAINCPRNDLILFLSAIWVISLFMKHNMCYKTFLDACALCRHSRTSARPLIGCKYFF